nr:MAG TPA: hypothetical protein [Caudoviricetes sp.]
MAISISFLIRLISDGISISYDLLLLSIAICNFCYRKSSLSFTSYIFI